MARRGRSLSEQVAAFTKKVEARTETFVREYAASVLESVVELSPVGDDRRWVHPAEPGYVGGNFKGNWQVSIGGPALGTLDRIDPTGSTTIRAGVAVLSRFQMGGRVSITNNLPYARHLEYGGSDQAPQGIVRITLAQTDSLKQQALLRAWSLHP